MGGVDKHDMLVSLFRTFIKSKKWTLRMMAHSFDMASTNSWLEYKKDAKALLLEKPMDLLEFKENLAESLIFIGKGIPFSQKKKRGRPSSSPSPVQLPMKKQRVDKKPSLEVQKDLYNHIAVHDGKPNSLFCKRPGCHLKSNWMCPKCEVHLCITKANNCFLKYHT